MQNLKYGNLLQHNSISNFQVFNDDAALRSNTFLNTKALKNRTGSLTKENYIESQKNSSSQMNHMTPN